MKKYVFIALGASLLMACTALQEEPLNNAASNPEEVNFSAYLMRGTTKAGATGELTTSTGTRNLQTEGFGVFGYHTDNALYSQAVQPNFMYNTKVSTASWTYSPIKYWPNEFGENASSEAIDRLTFFAYAPYVKVNSSTGSLDGYDDSDAANSTKTGITRLTRATDTGDPKVSYVVAFAPESSVDLCWGVSKDGFNKSAGTSEGTNSIAAGAPYINVARPNTGDKIAFGFEHALASLNVKIDASVAGTSNGAAMDAAQTRVYVRSVTFEGFAAEGSLNLNSAKGSPQWVNYYGNGALSTSPVTILDGRRDGREGSSADANEKPADLNPVIVQSAAYGAGALTAGVTTTAVNLFDPGTAGTENSPVYVIPNGDNLKVTIAYDVETIDDKILGSYLADGVKHGSVVENKITKTITGIGAMEAGKKYVVTLHLGLNSVDFDAEITDWGAGEDGTGNLPASSALAITNSTDPAVPFTSPMMLWGTGNATRAASAAGVPDGYSGGAFTYTSSDTSVATVDGSGVVTAVAPGEATITASVTATKSASIEASASYKVYVNQLTSIDDPTVTKEMIEKDEVTTLTVPVTINSGGEIYGSIECPLNFALDEGGDTYLTLGTPTVTSTQITIPVTGKAYGGEPRTITITDRVNSPALPQKTIQVNCAPEGTTGYLFSVSSGKKVYFAKSNLMWKGPTASEPWSLMEKPWSMVESYGSVSENYGVTAKEATVSLFGWGTFGASVIGDSAWNACKEPWETTTNPAGYGPTSGNLPSGKDWGANIGEQWRVLSGGDTGEWYYLLCNRGNKHGGVTVENVHGVIIVPDTWTGGLDSSMSTWTDNNSPSGESMTEEQWNAAYGSKGAVFLPNAGYRFGATVNGVNESCAYWSSTAVGAGDAYSVDFYVYGLDNNYGVNYGGRQFGYSVRLVREIE